jgi:hypothetical protein
MPKITIQPLGITIDAERGQTIMDAALAAAARGPVIPGGAASWS